MLVSDGNIDFMIKNVLFALCTTCQKTVVNELSAVGNQNYGCRNNLTTGMSKHFLRTK